MVNKPGIMTGNPVSQKPTCCKGITKAAQSIIALKMPYQQQHAACYV